MPQWLNLANLFTLLRLLSIPFVVGAILKGAHRTALALCVGAALTDGIDGAIARRWRTTTQVGAYLDPIADKLFLGSVFVSLAMISSVPLWFVVLIFARDFILLASSAAALLFTSLRRFPPSVWGKTATLLQVACATAILARNAGMDWNGAAEALVWPAAALTALSGCHYLWRGLRMLRPAGCPSLTAESRGSSLK